MTGAISHSDQDSTVSWTHATEQVYIQGQRGRIQDHVSIALGYTRTSLFDQTPPARNTVQGRIY